MSIKEKYFPIFLGIALLLLPLTIFLITFDIRVIMHPIDSEKSTVNDGFSKTFFKVLFILSVLVGGYFYWLFKK